MRPDRIAPIALGALAAGLVVAGLMTVGGPGEARRQQRDELRADDLSFLADCMAYLPRADWERLPEVMSEDAICATGDTWKDPQTGAPYTIRHKPTDDIEICAAFEKPETVADRYNLKDRFDADTGCIRVHWGG